MIQEYRKLVGMRTGGIKLYDELKQDFINKVLKSVEISCTMC
ncbi:hypothetical protein [Polaribacter sp. AHE13PA]|nr:hypothetical protein [Polaribacter sp. AHE13PA]